VQAWLKAATDPGRRRFDKGGSACYTAITHGKAGEGSQTLVVLFRFRSISSR
jgi:hypothetical protein